MADNGGMADVLVRGCAIGLVLSALACGGGGAGAPPGTPGTPAPSGQPPPGTAARVLVVTHTTGFRHDSIPAAEATLRTIGAESDLFQAEFCRTAEEVQARLTPSGLSGVDAVFFANTTGNLGIPDMSAFVGWIRGGKAFLGAHSASDTYHESPDYLGMLGGEFTTHGAIVEAEVRVNEGSNSTVSHLAPRFRMIDEWYRFRQIDTGTVLLSFDRNPPDGVGVADARVDLPLAWQKSFGSGRVFYTALGHRPETWEDARFRKHLLEAVRWAVGR